MKKTYLAGMISLFLVIAIVSVWAIGVAELFPPPWPGAPLALQGDAPDDALPFTDSLSAESCAKCHEKQYKEWSESMHSQAFSDPIHQAMLRAEDIPFCSGCHLPLTEQVPAFRDPATGEFVDNPDFIPELISQGVTCAVCHVRDWVRYGPPREGETEEEASQIHQVVFSEDYEKAEFCAKCHQDVWEYLPIPGTPFELIPPGETVLWDNTYGEWKAWQDSLPEGHSAKGKQCQGCHMPHKEHSWKGGHSPDMLKWAADVEVATDRESYSPGETVSASISLTNVGAGHKFPSGGSGGNNRMVTVTASIIDESGNVVDSQDFPPIMRQMEPPPMFFVEISDNRILPGETRVFDYSFDIPADAEGQFYLNTQVAYFLTPPFLFEAFGVPELIEQFPPTIIHDESKALILEKDYSNTFFVDLRQGLNLISLPLETEQGHTAQSFAEWVGATVVIKLNEETGRYTGYVTDTFVGDFPINGARGYIVNVNEAKTVAFAGAAWANEPSAVTSAPGIESPSGWAFVLTGDVFHRDGPISSDEYIVTAKNLRTGAVAVDTVKSSAGRARFAVVWADLSRKSVVEASDVIEITVMDIDGNQASEPIRQEISSLDIGRAFTTVRLEASQIPFKSELGQNYPNPTNPETWIPYKLVEDVDVFISIHDISGALIREIHLGHKSAGYYTSRSEAAYWNGRNESGEIVSSGIYFYSIRAGKYTATKKLLISR